MRLEVLRGSVPVGQLEHLPDARVAFHIDPEYRALVGRPVLGQFYVDKLKRELPPEPYLPAFFANLLPEGKLRSLILSSIGAREHHEFRLLAHLGRDLSGDITVCTADPDALAASEPPEPPRPRRELSGRLRFSIAGVQLKFSMLRSDKQLVLPARGFGGDWIVKLPADLPEVPENEYAVMSWARDSGITVPDFDVFTPSQVELDREFFGDGSLAFGVRRFDRPAPGTRVHIEDFAQVNGIHPFNKYDDEPEPRPIHTRFNYESLARQILTLCGEEDLREYIRRLVFVVLSGNADAHLKNWSLIYPDGRHPRLSPAYDLVCTIAYPESTNSELALPFANSLAFEGVSPDGFRRLASILRRDPEEMERWVREDIARIMDHRPNLSVEARYWLDEHHARLTRASDSLLSPRSA